MIDRYHRHNPSPRYRELLKQYQQLHLEGDARRNLSAEQLYPGDSLPRQAVSIKYLVDHFGARTILDYGALVFHAVHFTTAECPLYVLGTHASRYLVDGVPDGEPVPPSTALAKAANHFFTHAAR